MVSSTTLRTRCISVALNIGWRLAYKTIDRDKKTILLRALLRRFPYWWHGHRILAEESLAHDAVACAYASALCMQAIGDRSRYARASSECILGRCFLRRGDWREALIHLEAASHLVPNDFHVNEERAAALILGGDMKAACDILAAIPKHHISAEGKAALAFTSSKLRSC